jgi:hypothetical protein
VDQTPPEALSLSCVDLRTGVEGALRKDRGGWAHEEREGVAQESHRRKGRSEIEWEVTYDKN